jgi:RNA polymerase sigma-70 factor (ECF subfamily)
VPSPPEGAAVHSTAAAERLAIVAALTRATGDFDLAEDCFQDAVERALQRWPTDGVPRNPAAWLTTTARHRALDVLKRRQTERTKLAQLQVLADIERGIVTDDELGPYGDDRLRMLFTCCHPALPMAGRVALTLKSVAGLSTREIARAFLVSEVTMSQRLLRTKNKITHAGLSFRVPEPHRIPDRVHGVLAVIYLIFNEGYSASAGETFRDDLTTEAIQLADLVAKLLPLDDEARALCALLRFQQSRRAARIDSSGELVTMEDQDRSLWDVDLITRAQRDLAEARSTGRPPGYYRLQAEIAAIHTAAASPEDTDWPRIVTAYDALLEVRPSAVIELNRAVAVAFRDGPAAGLDALAKIGDDGLADYPLTSAVTADLLRRAGRWDEAAAAYREAIERAPTDAERRLLERRLAEVRHR